MSHARQQIREAFRLAVTGLAVTGNRVWASRVHPMDERSMPGIIIYTTEEQSESISANPPRHLLRSVEVVLEVYVKTTQTYDNELDRIAVDIERAVYANSYLRQQTVACMLSNTSIALTGEAEKPVGMMQMSFRVDYITGEDDPENVQ